MSKSVVSKAMSAFFMVLCLVLVVSCASSGVSRVDSGKAIDLTGDWNDTDVTLVCTTLINECLSSPRLASYEGKTGRLPVISVGNIRNLSDEHIDTTIISSKFSNAIINSGVADFLSTVKSDYRAERAEQENYVAENERKAEANEAAADFMLQGTVKTIVQKSGTTSVRVYYVTAELVDVERGTIVWSSQNDEIKKVVKEQSARW